MEWFARKACIIAVAIGMTIAAHPELSRPAMAQLDLGNLLPKGIASASIKVKNNTDKNITVVMDSNREKHKIKAHGSATFKKANIGDNPTMHILDGDGNEFDSIEVGVLTGSKTINYNG